MEEDDKSAMCLECYEIFENDHILDVHIVARHVNKLIIGNNIPKPPTPTNLIKAEVKTETVDEDYIIKEHKIKPDIEWDHLTYNSNAMDEEITIKEETKEISEEDESSSYDSDESSFDSDESLDQYFDDLENEKKYSCDFCTKRFKTKRQVVSHERVHTKERPFVCDICDRKFSHYKTLKNHHITHTNHRYYCDNCDKSFSRKPVLSKHIQVMHAKSASTNTTNGNQIHPEVVLCEVCGIFVKQMGHFRIHLRKHMQPKNKLYFCDICDKRFKSLSNLRRHVVVVHVFTKRNGLYSCDVCSHKCSAKDDLIKHKRSSCISRKKNKIN